MMTSKAKGQLDGGLLKIMSSFFQMTQKRTETLSTYKNEIKIINNLHSRRHLHVNPRTGLMTFVNIFYFPEPTIFRLI